MDVGIIKPRVFSKTRDNGIQQLLGGIGGIPDGSNSFLQGVFVYVDSSGNLIKTPTSNANSGVTEFITGLSIAASNDGTLNPPYTMQAKHFPLSVKGLQFAMNVGGLSGGALVVGQAGGAQTLATGTPVPGEKFGLAVATSGTYTGYPVVDLSNTTAAQAFFRIVSVPTMIYNINQGTPASTYNGIVIVQIDDSFIQNIS
jgi:hypothetical protein